MKLNEIVDTQIKHRNVRDYEENGEHPLVRHLQQKEKNPEGTEGLFSKVVPKKNDPFLVRKTNFDPIEDLEKNDGYFYYINSISKDQMAAKNPYFPRVYDVKIYKDSKNKSRFKADIEKLEEGKYMDSDELSNLGKKIFNDFDAAVERNINMFKANHSFDDRKSNERILRSIEMLLNDSLYSRKYVKDETLKEAIDYLDDLLRKNNKINLDLHDENFMFRRGKYGLQLVITDPFSNTSL